MYTQARTRGRYRLLILDGHGSHTTPEFDRFCSENSIIILCMPPHSSHLLQPLDIGCFSPLKRAYGQKVENSMRLGRNHIDKVDFLQAFKQAREEVLTASNIRSGFAGTGLVPFDPERVLSKLQIQLRTPSPSAVQARQTPKTPHTIAQLDHQYTVIKGLLQCRSQSPKCPTNQALN